MTQDASKVWQRPITIILGWTSLPVPLDKIRMEPSSVLLDGDSSAWQVYISRIRARLSNPKILLHGPVDCGVVSISCPWVTLCQAYSIPCSSCIIYGTEMTQPKSTNNHSCFLMSDHPGAIDCTHDRPDQVTPNLPPTCDQLHLLAILASLAPPE